MLLKHSLYYHTFGAPMATRNKQVSNVLVQNTLYASSFTSGTDGWVATTNATLSNVYGNIRATVTALNAGMQKTFSTEAGKTYRIRFKVNLRGWPYMYVKDVATSTNLISITDFMTPGDYSYTFTATGYQTNVIFHEAGNASGSVQLANFVLEEVEAENGYRFGFNGQEKDNEVSGAGNSMTAEFWQYDSRLGRRFNLDPKPNPSISNYACFANNPIGYRDIKGDTVWVFATTLPGAGDGTFFTLPTHTFIMVKTNDNVIHYYVYGPADDNAFAGGSPLVRKSYGNNSGGYTQDQNVMNGTDKVSLKNKIPVDVPKGMTSAQFDEAVIKTAESFGNNPKIEYNALAVSDLSGNCNSSTSTILSKSGVSDAAISVMESKIEGLNWGFGDVKPWTAAEQQKAVKKDAMQEIDVAGAK